MNRNDWEGQVYASNMNTTARMIAVVVGTFGNWTKDKTVEPGTSKIAQMAGVDRKTAAKYVEALVEQGWLKVVGTGRYNTTVYELQATTAPVEGILGQPKRSMTESQLRNLSTTENKVVAERVHKYREEQLRKRSTSKSNVVVETNSGSCGNEDRVVVETKPVVVDTLHTNLNEPSKNLEEPSKSPVPDGPVDENPSNIKEETPKNFYLYLSRKAKEEFLSVASLANASEQQTLQAVEILVTGKTQGTSHRERCMDALGQVGADFGEDW